MNISQPTDDLPTPIGPHSQRKGKRVFIIQVYRERSGVLRAKFPVNGVGLITAKQPGAMSAYLRRRISRFGAYATDDLTRRPEAFNPVSEEVDFTPIGSLSG